MHTEVNRQPKIDVLRFDRSQPEIRSQHCGQNVWLGDPFAPISVPTIRLWDLSLNDQDAAQSQDWLLFAVLDTSCTG